jgi:hypothetical protein
MRDAAPAAAGRPADDTGLPSLRLCGALRPKCGPMVQRLRRRGHRQAAEAPGKPLIQGGKTKSPAAWPGFWPP